MESQWLKEYLERGTAGPGQVIPMEDGREPKEVEFGS